MRSLDYRSLYPIQIRSSLQTTGLVILVTLVVACLPCCNRSGAQDIRSGPRYADSCRTCSPNGCHLSRRSTQVPVSTRCNSIKLPGQVCFEDSCQSRPGVVFAVCCTSVCHGLLWFCLFRLSLVWILSPFFGFERVWVGVFCGGWECCGVWGVIGSYRVRYLFLGIILLCVDQMLMIDGHSF